MRWMPKFQRLPQIGKQISQTANSIANETRMHSAIRKYADIAFATFVRSYFILYLHTAESAAATAVECNSHCLFIRLDGEFIGAHLIRDAYELVFTI